MKTALCWVVCLALLQLERVAAQSVQADVGIYGGTVCALSASVAAARMNISAAIIEPSSHLWGMTAGGLSGADLKMPLGGIALEFFSSLGHLPFPNFEPHVANETANALLTGAGPGVITVISSAGGISTVRRTGSRVTSVVFSSGALVSAAYWIDCSYDGDLLRLSGTAWAVGREATSEFNESLGGVDGPPWASGRLGVSPWLDTTLNETLLPTVAATPKAAPPGSGDALVQAMNYRLCLTNVSSNRLPLAPPANYTPAAMEVLRRWWLSTPPTDLPKSLLACFLVRYLPHGKIDVNQGPMPMGSDMPFAQDDYPTQGWPARTAIAAVHEWWTRAAWEFLRTDSAVPASIRAEAATWGLPADEFLATAGWPPQLYVRESIRMRGAVVLAQDDVYGAEYGTSPDSVGLSQWLVDVHAVRRIATPPSDGVGAVWDTVDAGDVNTAGRTWQLTEIPYGALTPARNDTQNLLVPVCASFTHVAFATYRLEPQYMVFGQSAAVAAVLALRAGGIAVQDVNVAQLQAELLAQGQLLAPPPPSSPAITAQACSRGSPSQQWAYEPSDGTLRLRGANGSSTCASVYGYSKAAGAEIWAAQCHPPVNASNQYFDLVASEGGAVQVRSRLSGLCVAVNATGGSRSGGVALSAIGPSSSPVLVQVTCSSAAAGGVAIRSASAMAPPANGTQWHVETEPGVGPWELATPSCTAAGIEGGPGATCLCAAA